MELLDSQKLLLDRHKAYAMPYRIISTYQPFIRKSRE